MAVVYRADVEPQTEIDTAVNSTHRADDLAAKIVAHVVLDRCLNTPINSATPATASQYRDQIDINREETIASLNTANRACNMTPRWELVSMLLQEPAITTRRRFRVERKCFDIDFSKDLVKVTEKCKILGVTEDCGR